MDRKPAIVSIAEKVQKKAEQSKETALQSKGAQGVINMEYGTVERNVSGKRVDMVDCINSLLMFSSNEDWKLRHKYLCDSKSKGNRT